MKKVSKYLTSTPVKKNYVQIIQNRCKYLHVRLLLLFVLTGVYLRLTIVRYFGYFWLFIFSRKATKDARRRDWLYFIHRLFLAEDAHWR